MHTRVNSRRVTFSIAIINLGLLSPRHKKVDVTAVNTSDNLQTFASLNNRPALRTIRSGIPDVYICSATTMHVWHYKHLMRTGKARRSSDATRFYYPALPEVHRDIDHQRLLCAITKYPFPCNDIRYNTRAL